MSMLAAPLVEGVAADAAGSAAAGTAAKGAAGAAAKAPRARVPAKTAASRAGELKASGASRAQASRTLSDEYGATRAQAGDLLDGVPDAPAKPEPAPAAPGPGLSLPSAPKSVSSAVSAGGGAVLGTLVYVVFLTYMRSGPQGVLAWLKAKFLNQVPGAGAPSTPATPLPYTSAFTSPTVPAPGAHQLPGNAPGSW